MRNRPLLSVCLVILCVMISAIFFGGERIVKELRPSPLETYVTDGESVTVCGTIYRREYKEKCQMVYLKHNSVYSNSEKYQFQESKIIIYANSNEKLQIGNQVRVQGKVSFYENARNPGNFDQKFYYQKQGIHGSVWADHIQKTADTVNRNAESLFRFRIRWKQLLIQDLGEKDGASLAAILIGEKNGMDQDTKELYRVNGIGHILAISGLHLSFAGIGIYQLLRRLTGSYKLGGLAGSMILFLYVAMIGMTVSVIRAFVMFLFRIGADMTGRRYDMPTALGVAAVAALLINPLYLYDGGFWLSFGAVFAICAVLPVISVEGKKKSKKAAGHDTIWQGILSGLGMNAVLWPVILYNFFELPIYSMLLNIFVIPLMSVVLSCGMIGSLVRIGGIRQGRLFLLVSKIILEIYEKCCAFTIKLPLARWVAGRPGKGCIFIYYLLLLIALLLWKYKKNRKNCVAAFVIYMMGVLVLVSANICRTGMEITMLDVGQGDCICIEGPDHKSYLVDGGSSDVKDIGKYRIEPFLKSRGIGKLDYVFVSHGDIDHMNGIEEMLKRQDVGVKIENMVVTEQRYWDETIDNLVRMAEENGTMVWTMEAGKKIKKGTLKITCLGPASDNIEKGNAASMILRLDYEGFDMLFTGDVEKEGEEELTKTLSKMQKEEKISWEVLKTAHHGSGNSTTEEFLKAVRPRYAWISAGRNNRYGHPHKDTIKRLQKTGAKIYSTQQNGAIQMTVRKKRMWIHRGNS